MTRPNRSSNPESRQRKLPPFYQYTHCAGVTGYPVVLAPSVCDSVEGNYLGLYRVLGGVWGKHTAHFMTVFGYGAVRYKYLWHHLPVCPYFSDDLVAQKYKTFCYMSTPHSL